MPTSARSTLADPALRHALVAMLRRRVPAPEVEEIVQATLTEALAARSCPDDPEAIRRWVHGIARHKAVDYHRRHRREAPGGDTFDALPAEGAPHDAADLLRWAERELPERGEGTLDWLLREGHGEKLEEIADDAQLPAPQVRQRVARMRKHFRARWAAQLAAAALLLAALLAAFALWRRAVDREAKHDHIAPDPIAAPSASQAVQSPAPSPSPSVLPPAPSPSPSTVVPVPSATAPKVLEKKSVTPGPAPTSKSTGGTKSKPKAKTETAFE